MAMMMGVASRATTRLLIRHETRCFASSLTSFDSTPAQKAEALIDRVIRVDQAGELAADRIYAGQMAVLGRTDVGPTIQVVSESRSKRSISIVLQHMWDEEKAHLAKFNQLVPKYKARPSALLPLWNVAGFALGRCRTSSPYSSSHQRSV